MFVQISHGFKEKKAIKERKIQRQLQLKHRNRRANSAVSDDEAKDVNDQVKDPPKEKEESGTMDSSEGSPVREIKSTNPSVLEGASYSQETLNAESTSNLASKSSHKSEQFFDKISEKASKYLPKRGSLGKFFGEKEPNVTVYTIDKEMRDKQKGRRDDKVFPRQEKFQSQELSDKLKRTKHTIQMTENTATHKTIGVQACPYPPYRLHFLPGEDWKEDVSPMRKILRILSCQCGLVLVFLLLLIFGALVFHLTEGPEEYDKAMELNETHTSIVIDMATDLRIMTTESPEDDSFRDTIEKYVDMHEKMVMKISKSGYADEGAYWTYSGSLLYCLTLLSILGFGSPVPQTMGGRIFGFFYAIIGIPVHFLLIMNIGLIIAVKVHLAAREVEMKVSQLKRRIQHARQNPDVEREVWPEEMFAPEVRPPIWLKFFPLLSIPIYYLLGLMIFGWARGMSFPEMLIYPSDFTERGALPTTYGTTRLLYTIFLEGAFILFSLNIALLCSTTEGIVNLGLRFGLVTNTLD